jgi:hypothetical protein
VPRCRYPKTGQRLQATPPGSRSTKASYESRILLRYTHEPEQADVAQQVEQLTRNEQVSGSSPLVGSLFFLQNIGKAKALANIGASLHQRVHQCSGSVMMANSRELIQGLRDGFSELGYGDENELDRLNTRGDMLIRRVFGESSHYLSRFTRIGFHALVSPVSGAYELQPSSRNLRSTQRSAQRSPLCFALALHFLLSTRLQYHGIVCF